MDKSAREALGRHIASLSQADQTEVLISHENAALTRFTHNTIHQNVAHADTLVSVRAIIDGQTGVARTNILDEDSLHDVVARASEMAKLAPKDPLQPSLPAGGHTETPPGSYIAETASATAHRRAGLAKQIFQIAERDSLWAAGFVTTSESGTTIVNSHGACASFDGTDTGVNVKMNGADSTGYAESYNADITRIDTTQTGGIAADKTLRSSKPKTVAPGEWTVILEPPAFGELLSYIIDHFSAQAFDEGSSFLSDGLGKEYMGKNVTLWDDYAHPLSPSMPFDFEGQPTKRFALIENGVAKAYVTDSYWAAKLKTENTGHALPAPNAWGPMPRNAVIAGGPKTTNQLISETKRGLLVSRFWYIRPVDQRQTIVTGMTRDGTFLIENGEITGGVRNMRFNQSILEALRHCEFSSEQMRTSSYSYSNVVPAAKIEGFRFSSGTDF
ncbi:MAG: TldD/PmbA family protein [Candidatus Eremiobacteraeota bacterium]|nr:TldD/PmbA family protein [Candidatus Eremiobacteraeota bacterium]